MLLAQVVSGKFSRLLAKNKTSQGLDGRGTYVCGDYSSILSQRPKMDAPRLRTLCWPPAPLLLFPLPFTLPCGALRESLRPTATRPLAATLLVLRPRGLARAPSCRVLLLAAVLALILGAGEDRGVAVGVERPEASPGLVRGPAPLPTDSRPPVTSEPEDSLWLLTECVVWWELQEPVEEDVRTSRLRRGGFSTAGGALRPPNSGTEPPTVLLLVSACRASSWWTTTSYLMFGPG